MKFLFTTLFFISFAGNAQNVFDQAVNKFNAEKYDEAKVLFAEYLQNHPNDPKALEYSGDIQCRLKHWKMALPYYENLRTLYPKQAEYQYKYGGALGMLARQSNVFAALSMIDNIKAAFTRAIALNPKHIPARWAMIELNLQLPEIVGGSKQKALAYSAELAVISPVDGYLSRGHIEEYFKRYANAEQQYLKAIEVSNSKTAYEKLAELYKNKMGQPQKAARLLAIFNQKNKS